MGVEFIMKRTLGFLAAFVLVEAALAGGAANPAAAARFEYKVVRSGDDIGRYVVDVDKQGDATAVKISTNVVVKIAFIAVYRFEQSASESWKGNQLVSLRSKTHDDGKDHLVSVDTDGSQLKIKADGRVVNSEPSIVPASLWNPALVTQTVLLNTVNGSRMKVSIADRGEETVATAKGKVLARHYNVSGGLERDLWFDKRGILVRVQMKGSDGSPVAYELQ
jgi:hypothetical protein